MNIEQSGSDLGLATGYPDVKTFDFLERHFSLSPSPFILYVDYRLCITWIIHQQLWGHVIEEKLHLEVK
jgi:hypothetical protein